MERDVDVGTTAGQWLGSCEQRFADVLELLGDGLILIDRSCRVRHLNDRAEQITGWSLEEARAVAIHEICQLYDRVTKRATWIPLEQVMSTGVAVACGAETTLVARNGRRCCIRNGTMPVCAGSGAVIGALIVLREQPIEQDRAAMPIDLAVLRARVGNDELVLHEFLRRFLVTARSLASALRLAVWRSATADASATALELGAAARAVGAWRLADACAELRDAMQTRRESGAAQPLERFTRELAAVERYLETF